MADVISTWYYEQSSSEGGRYAQVRGDPAGEPFRDVYRRCVGVFFATARRANPGATLHLYTNTSWDARRSHVAEETARLLERLNVEKIVLDYSQAPPPEFPAAWRNQFFVFDVMADLGDRHEDDDRLVILDSDVVWSSVKKADELWRRIGDRGAIRYDIGYQPSQKVNGLSRTDLARLANQIGVELRNGGAPVYAGGEFIACTGRTLRKLLTTSTAIYEHLR